MLVNDTKVPTNPFKVIFVEDPHGANAETACPNQHTDFACQNS